MLLPDGNYDKRFEDTVHQKISYELKRFVYQSRQFNQK